MEDHTLARPRPDQERISRQRYELDALSQARQAAEAVDAACRRLSQIEELVGAVLDAADNSDAAADRLDEASGIVAIRDVLMAAGNQISDTLGAVLDGDSSECGYITATEAVG